MTILHPVQGNVMPAALIIAALSYTVSTTYSLQTALNHLQAYQVMTRSVFVHSVCSPSSVHELLAHSSPHPTQSTNTYSTSSSTNGPSHSASSRPPASASNLRVAVLNANSVKGKRAGKAALCDTTNPDILIIVEIKLTPLSLPLNSCQRAMLPSGRITPTTVVVF